MYASLLRDGIRCLFFSSVVLYVDSLTRALGSTSFRHGDKVFATTGCDPKGQLMVWDSRMDNRPAHVLTATSGSSDQYAPYLSVASQPFNPEASKIFRGTSTWHGSPLAVGIVSAPSCASYGSNDDRTFPSHLYSAAGTRCL